MSAWVYVLHFKRPLAHAEHYSGCTRYLRGRLTTHALGYGSRLTKELFAQGIEWDLGGLFSCNIVNMRRIERALKDQHNGARFCVCCGGHAVPEGSTACDPANVPGWGNSLAVRCSARQFHTPEYSVRATNENDIVICKDLKDLGHENGEELGFIPVGGSGGLTELILSGRMIGLWVKGETRLVAYLAWTQNRTKQRVRIHQLCVRDEYRRRGFGHALVDALQRMHPRCLLSCNVKAILTANAFWLAEGFKPELGKIHLTSASKIIYYSRHPISLEQGV